MADRSKCQVQAPEAAFALIFGSFSRPSRREMSFYAADDNPPLWNPWNFQSRTPSREWQKHVFRAVHASAAREEMK